MTKFQISASMYSTTVLYWTWEVEAESKEAAQTIVEDGGPIPMSEGEGTDKIKCIKAWEDDLGGDGDFMFDD